MALADFHCRDVSGVIRWRGAIHVCDGMSHIRRLVVCVAVSYKLRMPRWRAAQHSEDIMNQIDRAIEALIPIPAVAELKATDERKLLELGEWLARWTHEIDTELRIRYAATQGRA
jgi:hypothetical protein